MNSAHQKIEMPRPTPWWREPWPWILMAGPALAIVGCAITIVLAVSSFSDQPILEGGMKRGLVVEKAPGKPPLNESR
ncbi:FixH family protein [Zwartia sp.]|uniref:FixH family protein n=1 Tax=Zwartia sp. TaxID=2978004 RepID=UPI003BAEC3B2